MMDKGEFIKNGYEVEPALNGGFVVRTSVVEIGLLGYVAAFSNYGDLLDFLESEHSASVGIAKEEITK